MPGPLDRLFRPRSIAVVGASPQQEKAGYQALRVLAAFPGKVFPIHPKAEAVLGRKAYPSLAAIGEPVDLSILAIPAAACPGAIREAGRAGCGAALIISGGFGEAGQHGLQDELSAACRQGGVRLLGPNTSGFINPPAGCCASFAPGVEELRAGPIAVVAQSGGVNITLAFQLHAEGEGVSLAAGLGNMVDVNAADVIEHLASDPGTRVILLHLEGIAYGRRLFDLLARVTPAKPVVAFPVGRADVGAFAQSHTGALIGSYERKAAALRQAGAVVVDSTEQLIDAGIALARCRLSPRRNPGVAIVTAQAGPGLIMVDRLKSAGVRIPELSEATVRQIAALLPPLTFLRNPVDTGRPGPGFPQVLAAVAADPAVDAILMSTIDEPAAVDPVAAITGVRAARDLPIVFSTAGAPGAIAPTLAALRGRGIPAFRSPERAVDALRVLIADAQAQAAARAAPVPAGAAAAAEVQSGSVPAGGPGLDEDAAKALLGRYGIATPDRAACTNLDEALAALERIGAPVAVKILSSEIAHKTEAGGVILGVATAAAMRAAIGRLAAIPLAGRRRFLVERMAGPGLELIAGAVRDPSFGPMVLVGFGGVLTEVLDDVVLRVAPIGPEQALDMLAELRGARLLDGYRGSAPVDRAAVAAALAGLSRLICDQPAIREIDINPLRACGNQAIALDALVVTGP